MSDDRNQLDDALDLAWQALDDGRLDDALQAASSLLAVVEDEPEVRLLAGASLFEAGDLENAEQHLLRALELEPDQPDALAVLGQVLFEGCRFDESAKLVARLLEANSEDARAYWLSGLLEERAGAFDAADASFERATSLDPESFSGVARMSRQEFDQCVEKAAAALPQPFRERLVNVAIMVEPVPSDALLAELEEPSPELLGLFLGTPMTDKSSADIPAPPDAVYLFKRNLERTARDRDRLVEEIRVTLLHEIGHYLGMDEDQIASAGYE
jgi:predicted Zn-dependent protease with MMP-like domain